MLVSFYAIETNRSIVPIVKDFNKEKGEYKLYVTTGTKKFLSGLIHRAFLFL